MFLSHIDVSLLLSPSLPVSLKINKMFKNVKKKEASTKEKWKCREIPKVQSSQLTLA